MYERKARQVSLFEDATLLGGVRLDPGNKWVRMARLIPWKEFEEQYAALFLNPKEGMPAKPAYMLIGTMILSSAAGRLRTKKVLHPWRRNNQQ